MELTPTNSTGPSVESVPSGESDRRDFMKKAAIGGAAAWATPVLLSSAAGAQAGTVPCNPILIDNNNLRSVDTASGADISLINNDPATDTQIAVAMVPLNNNTAATEVVLSGQGWVLLINKEISPPIGTNGDRLAMWVWSRQTNIGSPITFALVGAAAAPWRAATAGFEQVTSVGTAAATGQSGVMNIAVPSVTIPMGTAGLVMWVGATLTNPGAPTYGVPAGGYFQGTSDFLSAPNLNTGYLQDVPAQTLPASTVALSYSESSVGAQIPLLCTI
jgi:hypothetical protein